MLTRELLLYRVKEGVLRPSFISTSDARLLALAQQLLDALQSMVGQPRSEVEEAFAHAAGAFNRPRIARGLVKLLLDRCEFEAAEPTLAEARWTALTAAAQVHRGLEEDASMERYAEKLNEVLPQPLAEVRSQLYGDLPGRRPLLSFRSLKAQKLLERYNLALAQGPLLEAKHLSVRAWAPDLLVVRKVLRWLKFCRLVAEVQPVGEDWRLEVEGPAAMLSLQKKYGLQLASFLTVIPLFSHWELWADLPSRQGSRRLQLSHEDGLRSPHSLSLGHVPPEVASLAQRFEDEDWSVDTTPLPRNVGAAAVCVPDLLFRHQGTGQEVALELFHAWHADPLARRIEQLKTRPDPRLLLGVERSLASDALGSHPQVMLFREFPSPRKLKERLTQLTESG